MFIYFTMGFYSSWPIKFVDYNLSSNKPAGVTDTGCNQLVDEANDAMESFGPNIPHEKQKQTTPTTVTRKHQKTSLSGKNNFNKSIF